MPTIPGYRLERSLRRTELGEVFLGERLEDNLRVVIKVIGDSPTLSAQIQVEREASILAAMSGQGFCKALEVRPVEDGWALVMEAVPGQDLRQIIANNPMSLAHFLELAIATVRGLCAMHERELIHKDIKPSNIIVRPDNTSVTIIDVGTSAALGDIAQNDLGHLRGSLPYLAPEQTGRLEIPVDERSDLYSLGITFFEMLSGGKYPYSASSPLEWVHNHIAGKPSPLSDVRQDCPEILEAVVDKLLQKAPVDRYQSASGLLHDLKLCSKHLTETGVFPLFQLGQKDLPTRLRPSHVFLGRSVELTEFADALENVNQGRMTALCFSGQVGSGRSALLARCYAEAARTHARVVHSRCLPSDLTSPGSTFNRFLRDLSKQILLESHEAKTALGERLAASLGDLAGLLAVRCPAIGKLVPASTKLPNLPPQQAQARLLHALSLLADPLSSANCPLVLILDDMDHADSGSLEMLGAILMAHGRQEGPRPILFVTSHSPDPPESGTALLQQLAEAGIHTSTLEVGGLSAEELFTALAEMLGAKMDTNLLQMTQIIHDRTAGHPGAVHGYLNHLIEARIFRRTANGGFIWDPDALASAGAPDTLGDSHAQRLSSLSPAIQTLVGLSATIGTEFNIKTLANLAERPQAGVVALLQPLLHDRLIVPSGNQLRFATHAARTAACALLTKEQTERAHLTLARQLSQLPHEDVDAERLYAAAQHYTLAGELSLDKEEYLAISVLHLRCGQLALASTSSTDAKRHFERGLYLFAESADRIDAPVHIALQLGLAETLWISGHAPEASAIYGHLVEMPQIGHGDLSEIYLQWVRMETRLGTLENIADLGQRALTHLGMPMPEDSSDDTYRSALQRLAKTDPTKLLALPAAEDPKYLSWASITNEMSMAPHASVAETTKQLSLALLQLAPDRGLPPDAGARVISLSAALGTELGDYQSAKKYADVGMKLLSRLQDSRLGPRAEFIHCAILLPHLETFECSITPLARAESQAFNLGDIECALLCSATENSLRFLAGEHLHSMRTSVEHTIEVVRGLAQSESMDASLSRLRVLDWLQGRGPTTLETDGALRAFLDLDRLGNTSDGHWLSSATLTAFASVLMGRAEIAMNLARQCVTSALILGTLPGLAQAAFSLGLAAAARIRDGAPDIAHCQLAIEQSLKHLGHCTEFSATDYEAMLRFVEAERDVTTGDLDDAFLTLRLAHELAATQGRIHIVAMAEERMGALCLQQGLPLAGADHLAKARDGYETWGARAVTARMENLFGQHLGAPAAAQSTAPGRRSGRPARQSTMTLSRQSLDVDTIVRLSQAILNETELNNVLEQFLSVAIECTGARHGTLLLARRGDLVVEAVGHADGTFERVSIPLNGYAALPRDIIQASYEGMRTILISDAMTTPPYHENLWVQEHKARSILCAPILRQSRFIGILLLENRMLPGVFVSSRKELLQYISIQAAVSLDNARLYSELSLANAELEERVQQRTRELQLAKDQAEQARRDAVLATRAKSEFLASMSHEIRTPMNGVLGMAQLLQRTGVTQEQSDFLRTIRESGEALVSIINDILDLSKIEAGRIDLESTPFNLREAIDSVGEIMAPKAQEKGLELIIVVEHGVPVWAIGDSGRLRQIILNLANNSIKFTERGSVTITVESSKGADGEVPLKISVSDTGIGIPKDRIEQLFEAFTQADASTTRRFGGTGLGLTISKKLSESMGGHLRATSEEGHGSNFWFTARLGRTEGKPLTPVKDSDRLNCLIYDSNRDSHRALALLLEDFGIGSQRLFHLGETIGQVRNDDPSRQTVIFTHFPMTPEEEGAMRTLIDAMPIQLVLLSTSTMRPAAEAFGSKGKVTVINRPVRSSSLRQCLARILGQEEVREETAQTTEFDSSLPKMRVLIVEDNRVNQILASRMLKKLGYICDVAGDGKSGFERVVGREESWDLVLMDCQMPIMDGFESTRRIRKHEQRTGKHIPIIALTANAMKGDKEACLAAGMDDYVSKPIDMQALASTLDRYRLTILAAADELGNVSRVPTGND